MNKLLTRLGSGWLQLVVVFLFIFIPLYPKLPLLDVRHTWVYVRVEDFIVFFALCTWVVLVLRKKISLHSPLTFPIFVFWIIGAISTIHGLLLFFPEMANVFPSVVFLSFLRRIEYVSLFFIAYSSVKDKRFLIYVIAICTLTLVSVIVYGFGQKYFGFYAFLTMNEEFAKGIPIQLSQLSRVSSTFSGHYDLAAYLVLMVPIMASMVFGFKSWLVKGVFLTTSFLGILLLFMTVSRISFFALCVSLGIILFFQKKKLILFSIPILGVLTILIISLSPSLLDRFGNTVKEIDVLVDAKTGSPIGHPKEVSNIYFSDKVVKQQFSPNIQSIDTSASPASEFIMPVTSIPEKVMLLAESRMPTGEDLPQGTGYINLSLSPIKKKIGEFYYERKGRSTANTQDVYIVSGDYLIKKAYTYDLSFTTRSQGEWPRAIAAFKKNVLFGSGYGSVGLAVDNSYLRMLAETGMLGFGSFLAIFIIIGIFLRKIFPDIDSLPARCFVVGYVAGIVGLAINALFIDVFEASKIAFLLWLLSGVAMGTIRLYQNKSFEIYDEFKKVVTSTYAIAVYLFIVTFVLYSPMLRNYFVGDDFTWFRWAAQCTDAQVSSQRCQLSLSTIAGYFTHADGFFYRPGTKIYFLLMYSAFWLNQTVYHMVSLLLHFLISVLVFQLAKKMLKSLLLSTFAAFLFLILSGYSEAIFWISATGFLFTSFFSLLSLLSYISWIEKKKKKYLVATLCFFTVSLLFHELGIVTPLLYLLYAYITTDDFSIKHVYKDIHFKILHIPIGFYLLVRYIASSHWLSGDYNYSIIKFPFNAIGNSVGYFFLTLVGPMSLRIYQIFRSILREHVIVAILLSVACCIFAPFVYRIFLRASKKSERKILLFGLLFFIIALLPFLGLGNISSRYSYLSSIGVIFIVVILLKNLYAYLLTSGRAVATGALIVVMSVFFLFQIIEQQQLHSDWYESGEKVRRFFIAMDSKYDGYWATDPMEFYFVNVPIRSGEAWIFPVGIKDALWLTTRNSQTKVYIKPTLSSALDAITYDVRTQKVFEFDADGEIIERKKIRITP